ncbi:hypothetical protein RQP54_02140 [Curvibacter sp. APW13]|uniref:hypothetical protein n=1 Tax=Curvibacter sp. APW13 TaxID=3077236 RepID=UPI0028DF79ED|nr:hypothetical protein [Curvibacter sp. APW13]MDT8989658.1 hypothetical protein [Curvibacter sp. APW13]
MSENVKDTTPTASVPAEVWVARKRNNVRLAWAFGGVAIFLFVMALWKLRPM